MMNLPIGIPYLVAATIPVIFLLIMIMKFGWGVAKAAPYGMIIAFLIGIFIFKARIPAMGFEVGKGAWSAATILLVIWPAVFSYELSCESKGFQAIRQGIHSITKHELLQILIFGWIFPSFLQGITGFGVAVAVGAPLLLSIGIKPLYSIIIVLLCHCWGATFGTLALAWDALVAQAGMTSAQNAQSAMIAALMIWLFNLTCVLICCYMYGKMKAIKEGLPIILLFSVIMGGGELLLAPINYTMAFFLPCAVGLAAAVLIGRTKHFQNEWKIEDSPIMERKSLEQTNEKTMTFHQAFLPYYILTLITVICLLIPPITSVLSKWKIGFSFPQTMTGYGFVTKAESIFSPLKPLTYAGTFLVISSLISFLYYKKKGFIKTSDLKAVWIRTVKKCVSPTKAILCLIIMSKFMSSSGMIYVLSRGIVNILGKYYVIVAPFFGMIGAFITSSNMSSNILLGNFQSTAAGILNINPAVTCALQTMGGILGDAFAPGSMIMGISTTGYKGKDGDILKKIVPISIGFAAVYGLIAFLI